MGGGAKAVADALGCDKKEAQKFVDAYANGFKGISEFKKKGSKFVKDNGYINICKLTGHRLIWEDWNKWRAIEDDLYYENKLSKSEIDEHRMAGAKWDRLALNVVTQGGIRALYKLLKFGEYCDVNTEPSYIVIYKRCND